MDCIGAAIGIFRAVKSRGKEAYIVNESNTVNSRMLIEEFSQIPEYEDAFISAEQTLNIFNNGTLVVVVDVHRPSMVDCPELLEHAKEVVLIDHHRKSEDFIENPVLVYHEPYASSTCEMITEIFQYIQEGQRTLFETVINVKDSGAKFEIPHDPLNVDGLNFIAGKELSYVNETAMLATLMAHKDGGVPNLLIELDDRSAYSFGYIVYFFEFACAMSGYMMGVNPFDQPGVEAYKKNMFALLGKPGYEALRQELEARLG
jgi:hypothetical protein